MLSTASISDVNSGISVVDKNFSRPYRGPSYTNLTPGLKTQFFRSVRDVWGSWVMMLSGSARHETSPYDGGRGVQVSMDLEHEKDKTPSIFGYTDSLVDATVQHHP